MAKFEDHSQAFLQQLRREVVAWAEEVTGLLESTAVKRSRTDTGQTKGSYRHKVVDDASSRQVEGYVGSNQENAIWEEFGTGEYALGGKGRKTPWYVPVDGYQGKKRPTYGGKVVVVYGKNKKKYYKTDGKKPNQPLLKAYRAYPRKKMLRALEERLRKI